MDASFWHQKWERGEIGFHESQTNLYLLAHIDKLNLATGARLFLPLCGKTLDIAWLLGRGYRIAGAELSALAIDELFKGLGLQPNIVTNGALTHYSAHNIDIFVGDIFSLSHDQLGAIDAIYDRAALVALPEALRKRYTTHLMQLCAHAPQLLICFVYDQSLLAGPPFSVGDDEVNRHYAAHYDLALLARVEMPEKFKGKAATWEHIWLLQNRRAQPAPVGM